MSRLHVSRPPRAVRRHYRESGNIALVPASLLPLKHVWQQVANELPDGDALFVVPGIDSPLRRSMAKIAAEWRARGRRTAALDASQLTRETVWYCGYKQRSRSAIVPRFTRDDALQGNG